MKKIIIAFTIVLFLTSCSTNTENSPPLASDEILDEQDNYISTCEKISKETNIPLFLNADYDYRYTIELQRNLLNKTFIHSSWDFDISETNNKIYLKENEYYRVLLLEISEKQLEQILSKNNISEIVYSFSVENIYPIDSYFYPECDLDTNSEEYIPTDDISDYITPYTEIAVDKQILVGKINEIYEISESN